jgi:hypothetical protein
MFDWIIAVLVSVVMGLWTCLTVSKGRQKKLKEEAEFEKKKATVLEHQMETVNEVRKELKLIEDESKPQAVEAPPRGDSSSRLDRLNRLHDN